MSDIGYNMNPDLRCISCWGLRQTLGSSPEKAGWDPCKDCNGTGIAPIPYCEVIDE